MKCSNDDIIEYIEYLLARTRDNLCSLQHCRFGTIVKFVVDNNSYDSDDNIKCSYRHVSMLGDVKDMLNYDFLLLPYVESL
jgi:hypothetical protein